MSVVNHFILNSDTESIKIVGTDILIVDLPAVTLSSGGQSYITTDRVITVPEGVYIDISSTKCSWIPNVATTGISQMWWYAYGGNTYGRVGVSVKRTSPTTYTVTVEEGSQFGDTQQITIPALTITVKLTRLVPTTQ